MGTNSWPGDRAPRSAAEIEEVITQRPPLWEYLCFYGSLYLEKQLLEPEYRDFEMGYAAPTGRTVQAEQVILDVQQSFIEYRRLVSSLSGMMSEKTVEWAMGAPGEPGDPERIKALAHRWTSVYGDMLAIAARLRGTACDPKYVDLVELAVKLSAEPIRQYRQFVDDMIAKVDLVPAAVVTKKSPIDISGDLKMSMDKEALADFEAELGRLSP
jgi:hypothetical protein